MIRSEGGKFFEHFLKSNSVSIGHLDKLNLSTGHLDTSSLLDLRKQLELKSPNTSKASITSHVNQILAFCNEVQIGDVVATLNSRLVQFGTITSKAFIEKQPFSMKEFSAREFPDMPFQLRRSVDWGELLLRNNLNSSLEKSLQAHQTVFNLDNHWQSIYHTLYPYFVDDNNDLYSSYNIGSKNPLSNFAVSNLFFILNGIEALSELAISTDLSQFSSFDDAFSYFANTHTFKSTTKAEFASPGSIWNKLAGSNAKLIIFYLFLSLQTFGGEISVPGGLTYEVNGLIDQETKKELLRLAVDMYEKYHLAKIQENLKTSQPDI